MSNYNERVNRLWDEWISETGKESGDPDDFINWASASGKLAPRPQDIRQILRKQVTQALRQARRYDEDGGFAYRAKQSVTLFDAAGMATKHYFDTDAGGTQTLRQKSTRQRREAIAHDIYRGVCDVEHMNKVHDDQPSLNFHPDFTDDVAELRAAELQARDDDDAAA